MNAPVKSGGAIGADRCLSAESCKSVVGYHFRLLARLVIGIAHLPKLPRESSERFKADRD